MRPDWRSLGILLEQAPMSASRAVELLADMHAAGIVEAMTDAFRQGSKPRKLYRLTLRGIGFKEAALK